MAKEVTVLSLEGKLLRGVRLAESGGGFARQLAETWTLDPEAGEEGGADAQDRVPSDADGNDADMDGRRAGGEEDGAESDAPTSADLIAQAFHEAVTAFKTHEFILSVPLWVFIEYNLYDRFLGSCILDAPFPCQLLGQSSSLKPVINW